jgi:DNA-binding IscR family transcriptional regulator
MRLTLGKAGFLLNVRGHGGGLGLARSTAQIGVAAIVRQAEGVPLPATCFEADAARCAIGPGCRLKSVLEDATDAFYAILSRYTIADRVAGPGLGIISTPTLSKPGRLPAHAMHPGEPTGKGTLSGKG